MSDTLPKSINKAISPAILDRPGWWLVASDFHIPFHDRKVIRAAVETAKKHKAVGILLNGDISDSHEISRFDKSPDDPKYRDEIKAVRQFLRYIRNNFPKADLVYKIGNHDARFYSYLCRHAPALFGLDDFTLPSLLRFDSVGVRCVEDLQIMHLGKLNVIHGHEYRPMIQTPVNPARGVFLRAKSVVLVSHFHQVSEHHEPNINGKPQGAWSVGCCCHLNPVYMPLNKWSHGFAMVKVGRQGDFEVRNLRVKNGKVI